MTCVDRILDTRGIGALDKLIGTWIARACDRDGFCFASGRDMADALSLTEPTIRQHVSRLVAAGLVTVDRRAANSPGVYRVTAPEPEPAPQLRTTETTAA